MSFGVGGGGLVRVSGGSTVCPDGLVKKSMFLFDTLRKEKARPLSQLESLTLSQDKLKEVFQVKDATRSR